MLEEKERLESPTNQTIISERKQNDRSTMSGHLKEFKSLY
jgi:hypothetical protein